MKPDKPVFPKEGEEPTDGAERAISVGKGGLQQFRWLYLHRGVKINEEKMDQCKSL